MFPYIHLLLLPPYTYNPALPVVQKPYRYFLTYDCNTSCTVKSHDSCKMGYPCDWPILCQSLSESIFCYEPIFSKIRNARFWQKCHKTIVWLWEAANGHKREPIAKCQKCGHVTAVCERDHWNWVVSTPREYCNTDRSLSNFIHFIIPNKFKLLPDNQGIWSFNHPHRICFTVRVQLGTKVSDTDIQQFSNLADDTSTMGFLKLLTFHHPYSMIYNWIMIHIIEPTLW